ncbi:hypothetical protein [Massilia sp. CCM 8734]|uniref:hypothetical protein n=1 Tax=Massilia sp. CCM 8734 TaxID=2609283 RepID=UPI00142480F9|nr:hypothetical protein [Massilia sp. CCM 8734]NHZ94770.1 hypothetical protein [Massilia sp. CCM 8734]
MHANNRARRAFCIVKRCCVGLLILVPAYVVIAANPEPLFSHRATHRNYQVWSDRPIPASIAAVLDDATRRWRTSALYDSRTRVNIFFCNEPWRLWFYSGHFNTNIGGTGGGIVVENIFIRASDIAANRIHAPGPGPIADAEQRPLSYFIAHEITHSDHERRFGRLAVLRYPQWLVEGHADYVAKGGAFDFEANRKQFADGDPALDFDRSGLYREFHLKTAYLIDKRGKTLEQLFADPPSDEQLESALRAYRPSVAALR